MLDLAKLSVTFIAGTLGQGGAERQLYYIMKVLAASGTRVQLLSLTRHEYWEAKIKALGVPVIWVGESGSKLARLRRIIAELRKQPTDIVQSQHFFTNLYAVAAAYILKLREVGAIRSDPQREIQATGRFLGGLCLQTPRRIAANSKAAICSAVSMGIPSNRLYFLPNVIDFDEFQYVPRTEANTVTLITVGRLVKPKRHDRFLSLLARLRRQTKLKIKGEIVGDGPLRGQLEKQAGELGLGPDILEFKGKMTDLHLVYKKADIFVLTSDFEGTPNVILEAMASGMPVVSRQIGGIPDLIEHGKTGFLSEVSDETSMDNLLLQLMENVEMRRQIGQRARDFVVSSHSLPSLSTSLAELYRSSANG